MRAEVVGETRECGGSGDGVAETFDGQPRVHWIGDKKIVEYILASSKRSFDPTRVILNMKFGPPDSSSNLLK
jgi:hypothetical protein